MERQSEKARHRSSFYAAVYSEVFLRSSLEIWNPHHSDQCIFYILLLSFQIEEVGWESLVRSEEDLTALTFRIR